MATCPIPVLGLSRPVLDLLREHNDRQALAQLRLVARSEEWKRLEPVERAAVAEWARRVLGSSPWLAVVVSIFGTRDRSGRWRDAPQHDEAAPEDAPLVTSGADLVAGVDPTEGAVEVAAGIAYRERTVLVDAQRGAGKSTLATWLASRSTVDGLRVLVVGDDDPGTWKARMVGFGAKHDQWAYGEASTLARPGAVERAVSEFKPDWIVFDNWRTWGVASGVPDHGGFGNTEAVAVPIERIVKVSRGGPAVTLLSNEGYHDDTRSRDSSVVEDAVDATRKVVTDELARITTLRPSQKTRTGIDRHTRRWRLRDDDSGMDPITDDGPATEPEDAPFGPVSEFARKWLATNPNGSQRKFEKAARGAGLGCHAASLRRVFKTIKDGCVQTPPSLPPDAPDAGASGKCVQPRVLWSDAPDAPVSESASDPIGDTPSGRTPGRASGTHSPDAPEADGIDLAPVSRPDPAHTNGNTPILFGPPQCTTPGCQNPRKGGDYMCGTCRRQEDINELVKAQLRRGVEVPAEELALLDDDDWARWSPDGKLLGFGPLDAAGRERQRRIMEIEAARELVDPRPVVVPFGKGAATA